MPDIRPAIPAASPAPGNRQSMVRKIISRLDALDRLLYAALQEILILPIRLYQITLSPLIGRQCRHWPTCSHYAIEAIRQHGPFYGFWLAFWRVVRCNPLFPGGVDPVPPVRQTAAENKPGKHT